MPVLRSADRVCLCPRASPVLGAHLLARDSFVGIRQGTARTHKCAGAVIGDPRYDTPDARLKREAEVDEIVSGWTRERTKHEAMTQLSAVGVPAGAVLDSMELTNEPSFRERGILQTMKHGEREMTMPTWPVRFDGVPTAVKPAPLLGEHTGEVLADWLGLDADAVGELRRDGIV